MSPARPPWRETALVLACFAALTVATTWPLLLHPGSMIYTRYFDAFAALWLLDVAPDLAPGMTTDRAAWPLGQVLRRADSQLMVVAGRLLTPLLGPVRVFNLFVLLGPVLSAWAAEAFARRTLGARRPWSLLAGLTFAYGGLSATSILEGHAYFLLVPWLPLLAMHWWATTGPDGRPRDGLLAGSMWALCLLTSGYMGVLGAIVVLAGLPRALPALRARLRPLGAAAAVALPVGLLYVLAFATGGDAAAQFYTDGPALSATADAGLGGTAAQLQSGSSGLFQLIGVRLTDDGVRHGIAPALSLTAVILALLAGRILPRDRPWRAFQLLGIAGMALALGPTLELVEGPLHAVPWLEQWLMPAPSGGMVGGGPPWPGFPALPWLLAPLALIEGDVFFHFPYRFAWLAALGFGGVAAAAATRLADRLPPRRRWLVGGLLVAGLWDATGRVAVRARAAPVPLEVPSAYAALAGGAGGVLELWARPAGGDTDADLRMNNLTCTYQRVHGRPMVSDCIGTGLDRTPRVRLTHWVTSQALAWRMGEPVDPMLLHGQLRSLGVGAVVVHPLLFEEDDLKAVHALLRAGLGPPAATSEDAGDPVVVYTLPAPATKGAAKAAWATWTSVSGPARPPTPRRR